MSLDRVRRRIAEAEQREAAMRTVRAGPAEPGWVLAYLRERGRPVPATVPTDDCSLAGEHTKPLTRDEARHALTEGALPACEIRRPDSDLGLLDRPPTRAAPGQAKMQAAVHRERHRRAQAEAHWTGEPEGLTPTVRRSAMNVEAGGAG